jgi:hypothetical protein
MGVITLNVVVLNVVMLNAVAPVIRYLEIQGKPWRGTDSEFKEGKI